MKRLAFLVIAIAVFATSQPVKAYESAGCGLGAMIFKEDDFTQIFAATTNATLYNQMFAITSGTSGCREETLDTAQVEQKMFVASNFDNLSQDLARGAGEYADAFATLMGCPRDDFHSWSRENFEKLNGENPDVLYRSIRTNISTHPEMSKSCSKIGKA